MNFAVNDRLGMPSCTKTVTIRFNETTIKIKQNKEVNLNGQEIVKFPFIGNDYNIQMLSSIFLIGN